MPILLVVVGVSFMSVGRRSDCSEAFVVLHSILVAYVSG